MLIVHRVGDRLLFEIPAKELNQDSSWSAAWPAPRRGIKRRVRADGFGEYAGDQFSERTLRWERNGNRIILRSISYAITADSDTSVLSLGTEFELRSCHRAF